MNLKQLFLYFILHCIVFVMIFFFKFYTHEYGRSLIFGIILYSPYIFALSGLNILLICLGLKKITIKRPDAFLTVFFTNMVLATWYLLKDGQIKIRFWELNETEFLLLNFVVLTLNLLTVVHLTRKKQFDTS